MSVSSNVGFVVASIIATCAYIAGPHTKIFLCGRKMLISVYTIFIGPPGTGRSQVLKECMQYSIDVICEERGTENLGLHRCTPFGVLHSFVISKEALISTSSARFVVISIVLRSGLQFHNLKVHIYYWPFHRHQVYVLNST